MNKWAKKASTTPKILFNKQRKQSRQEIGQIEKEHIENQLAEQPKPTGTVTAPPSAKLDLCLYGNIPNLW